MLFGESNFFSTDGGGDPILFQNVFWTLGHWEIYPVLISSVIVIAIVIAISLRCIRRRKWVSLLALCTGVTSVVSLYYAGFTDLQQQYIEGVSPEGLNWTIPALITVWSWRILAWSLPLAFLIWLATKRREHLLPDLVSRLYVLSAIIFLVALFVSAFDLSNTGADSLLHDTYYVVAHVRHGLVILIPLIVLPIVYRFLRERYSRTLGVLQFAMTASGMFLIFWPQFFLGNQEMPRHYVDYDFDSVRTWETVSLIGYGLFSAGLCLFVIVLVHAFWRRSKDHAA